MRMIKYGTIIEDELSLGFINLIEDSLTEENSFDDCYYDYNIDEHITINSVLLSDKEILLHGRRISKSSRCLCEVI